ncbi:unnamed protein product [Linum trigynum]|uniref:Uncharacterized protein n=1 Tax=Linum trigynum TaxID=586398 RepID=A0AAV2GFC4_9ROSI
MDRFLLSFWLLLFLCAVPKLIICQQSYSGNSALDCDAKDAAAPYSCNGEKPSCKAFLMYKAQPPYNTLSRISSLTFSDSIELARINNVSDRKRPLPTGQEVLIPVTCSCTGSYYKANSSYRVHAEDTYFKIANDTYEGLSTCNVLMQENRRFKESELEAGQRIQVPLRCACPTRNQTVEGTKFLLTYLVDWGDGVANIGERFNASRQSLNHANGFGELDDPTIYPFTTLLIPLQSEPNSSQTIIHSPPPSDSPSVVPIQPSSGKKSRKSRRRNTGWIVLGVSSTVLSLVLAGAIISLLRKKEGVEDQKKKKLVLPEDFFDGHSTVDQGLRIRDFEELKLATVDFSSRLSERVYKGVINGQEVAIKKTSRNVSSEVNLLRKINHFNLISLAAAYQHQDEYYLVYKYMENGSLKDWLQKKGISLYEARSWSRRLQIALDIANGLHYLHNFTEPPYVHKDISSSNILLDADLRAKIANFSLARSAEVALYASSSIRVAKGAKGYLAPEYVEYGLVIPEIDVYAFGVVLLELITRKEAVFLEKEREVLLSEAIVVILSGEHSESALCDFVDPGLHPKQQMVIVLRMMKLILACLAKEPEDRPSMGEIVSSLSKIQLDVYRSEFMYCSSS